MNSSLSIEDITTKKTRDDGGVSHVFDRAKAAKSLCDKLTLTMTDTTGEIWRYNGQIYQDNGKEYIKNQLYSVAGNVVDKKSVGEVLDRVTSRLQLSPVIFNADPCLLGVKNGVLNCKDGTFRPYSAQDLITDQLPITYDPDARCPEIISFIESLTPDIDDRLTLVDIIASGAYRRALAYVAFLIGHGSSGSSTFIHLLQAFYGESNTEALPLNELVEKQFAVSCLKNARYSVGQEIETVKKAGTARIKEISGGDWISADVKNRDRARFRGWTKLIFKGNSVPRFTDNTFAFRRRFVEVKLPYKFVPEIDGSEPNQRIADPDIEDKITSPEELSGLLNLIIDRLPIIIKDKRIHRKDGHYDAYKLQLDSVTTFLDEFCTFYSEAITIRKPIKDIYDNFLKWGDLVMANQVDVRQFGRYVKHYCENKPPLETTVNGKTTTVYPGLSFDQEKFNNVITDLENQIKPDSTGYNTGLEEGQQILITGYTGLSSSSYVTWGHIRGKHGNCQNDPILPVFDNSKPGGNPISNPVKPDINPVNPAVEEYLHDGGQNSLQRLIAEFPEAA